MAAGPPIGDLGTRVGVVGACVTADDARVVADADGCSSGGSVRLSDGPRVASPSGVDRCGADPQATSNAAPTNVM